MTKTTLTVLVAAAALAVGAIAAVTVTVIVDDGDRDGGARLARLGPGHGPDRNTWPPGPGGPGRGFGPLPGMQGLRDCLQKQGLGGRDGRETRPGPQKMRDALEACRGALPGLPAPPTRP